MTLSLCRAQEFYEASQEKLRGKYFSWETFIDAFTDDGGAIGYFSFWSGFNFPGSTYSIFLETFQDDLSERERLVSEEVKKSVDTKAAYYVIGTLEGAVDTVQHEILHALYHVDASYRKEAVGLVLDMDHGVRTSMAKGLAQLGYGDNVTYDEIQAYLGSASHDELRLRFGLSEGDCSRQCPPFRTLALKFLDREMAYSTRVACLQGAS